MKPISKTPGRVPAPRPTKPKSPARSGASDSTASSDSVSLGYKVARGTVSTVGSGIGGAVGFVKGGIENAGAGKAKAAPITHKILRYGGAVAALAAAGAALVGGVALGGALAGAATLLVAPVAGAAVGGAIASAAEALVDSGTGAGKGAVGGARLGWQIAGSAVDTVASVFGAGPKAGAAAQKPALSKPDSSAP